jgi:hypothetical protein
MPRMQETSAVEELAADASSRKRFLRAVGGTAAAGALAAVISACGSEKKPELTPGGSNPNTGAGVGTDRFGKGDLGIVRYALLLDYIESMFYEDVVGSGKLTGRAGDLAQRFGAQERQHVQALERAVQQLGGELPPKPKPQFGATDQQAILQQALSLEGLGAAALLAQADRIADKEVLALALSMHSVEARHAAAFASLLNRDPAPQGPYAQPANVPDVLNQLHELVAV